MNRQSAWRYRILAFFLISVLSIAAAHTSFAQDFTALSLGDYGNATVMEVTGNYGANNPDGSVNAVPRQAISKEFFKTHKDEYDFLVIFSNFDFQMPDDGHAKAFYMGVKNDTQGIGARIFNNSSNGEYGSSGKLQGIIDMGNISGNVSNPIDPLFDETLRTLSHELMHRWSAYAKFRNADGSDSTALLGKDDSHWSFLLDTGGSVLYGNRWQDNGNGTFTSLTPHAQMKYFSPLDLYLMGMIDKNQVPPMLLIENSSIDPKRFPEAGVSISGTTRTVTIDDIIAATGPRIPDASISQKSFKTAFIFITNPGTFTGNEIYGIENIRNGWVTRHSVLTDGKSIVQVASTPKEDILVNPGVIPPSITPRTLPANIEDGVQWLINNQQPDGSWTDLAQTAERDTAEAVLSLRAFDIAQANRQSGLTWLVSAGYGNNDYLSRKLEALAAAGQDVASLVQELLSIKNSDGAWGSGRTYASNSADTALALKALAIAGYSDQTVISKTLEYLKATQKADGGWTGNGESTIQATA